MPKVSYGTKTIEYSIQEREELKSHYISVERDKGVVLRGKPVSSEQAHHLVLKRAKWILDKLDLVAAIEEGDIVTGSRIQYLGRRYYVQVIQHPEAEEVSIEFNESKFKITLSPKHNQQDIKQALQVFFKEKAVEKITPRVKKLSKETGLEYTSLRFRKLEKRWGSCTANNTLILNFNAVKLPYSLIDYLIIHELVHTRIKNHSKEFWAELSKHLPNWKELDEKMLGMKL